MNSCPHCKARRISHWAKRWSTKEYPTQCPACNGLSHVIASTSSGIPVLTLAIACITLLVADEFDSYLIGSLGMMLAICYNLWAWQKVPLFPTFSETTSTAKRTGFWVEIVAVIVFFMQ